MVVSATVDDVMAWEPCSRYPRSRIEQLWGNHSAITRTQFLELKIPPEDLNWGALQPFWWSDTELRQLCGELIKSRLQTFETAHPEETQPRQFLALIKQYLNGQATLPEVKTALGVIRTAVQNEELPGKALSFLRAVAALAWALDDDEDAPEPKNVARVVWSHLSNYVRSPAGDVQRIKTFLRNLP